MADCTEADEPVPTGDWYNREGRQQEVASLQALHQPRLQVPSWPTPQPAPWPSLPPPLPPSPSLALWQGRWLSPLCAAWTCINKVLLLAPPAVQYCMLYSRMRVAEFFLWKQLCLVHSMLSSRRACSEAPRQGIWQLRGRGLCSCGPESCMQAVQHVHTFVPLQHCTTALGDWVNACRIPGHDPYCK